jgi:hypothetical protein
MKRERKGRVSERGTNMSESKQPAELAPFREPDEVEKEVLEEWAWVMQERGNGRFDEYAGQNVAVVNKVVLGSSTDPNLLRTYVAEKHHIDPRRIVIFAVYAW